MILRVVFRMQEQPRSWRGQTNTFNDLHTNAKLIGDLVSYGQIAPKVNGEFYREDTSKDAPSICK